MAAAKKNTAKSQAALEKRNQTREVNANLQIDFSAGLDPSEMTARKAASRSMWPVRILSLYEGVVSGPGEVDTFYKIGEFGTPTGASAVITSFRKDPDRLPVQVILEARKVGTGDDSGSELWGLIPSDEYLAALEDGDEDAEAEDAEVE